MGLITRITNMWSKEDERRNVHLLRNDLCWCGSGKKYKHCHLDLDEPQRQKERKMKQAGCSRSS